MCFQKLLVLPKLKKKLFSCLWPCRVVCIVVPDKESYKYEQIMYDNMSNCLRIFPYWYT